MNHTAVHHWVTCDQCNEAPNEDERYVHDTPAEALEYAQSYDWETFGEELLCPPCQDEREDEEAQP